jgi:phage shock protein A
MGLVELLLLRLVLWVGLPLLLVMLIVGPTRLRRFAGRVHNLLWRKQLEPEQLIAQVVRQHEELVVSARKALAQAEAAEADILRNMAASQEHVLRFGEEVQQLSAGGDELGARGAEYKLSLERAAIGSFEEQLKRVREMIADVRRRLYLLELQLRQYEVGRSLLLSQLAQAKGVEQQYAIVSQFDPFDAVANWRQAEGLVQEKALNAKAIERVYADLMNLSLDGRAPELATDPDVKESLARRRRRRTTDRDTAAGNVGPISNEQIKQVDG